LEWNDNPGTSRLELSATELPGMQCADDALNVVLEVSAVIRQIGISPPLSRRNQDFDPLPLRLNTQRRTEMRLDR